MLFFKQKYILSWILNQLKTLLLVTCPSFGCLIGQFWDAKHLKVDQIMLQKFFKYYGSQKPALENYLINIILEHCLLKLIYLVLESTMPNSTAPLPKEWI